MRKLPLLTVETPQLSRIKFLYRPFNFLPCVVDNIEIYLALSR